MWRVSGGASGMDVLCEHRRLRTNVGLARGPVVGHDEGKPLEDFREGVMLRDPRETRKCDRRPLQ